MHGKVRAVGLKWPSVQVGDCDSLQAIRVNGQLIALTPGTF
jgi:hypothetical protein